MCIGRAGASAFFNTLLLLAMAGLLACSGTGSTPDAANLGDPSLGGPRPDFTLPSPQDMLQWQTPRATAAAVLLRQGQEFELGQRAQGQVQDALLQPQWTGNAAPFADVAYGVYRFNLAGYSGPQTLQLSWTAAPGDYANLWVGLSHWGSGTWKWMPGPADGLLQLGGSGLRLTRT
jgi:hypothetical protein